MHPLLKSDCFSPCTLSVKALLQIAQNNQHKHTCQLVSWHRDTEWSSSAAQQTCAAVADTQNHPAAVTGTTSMGMLTRSDTRYVHLLLVTLLQGFIPWVTWEAVTGVAGILCRGLLQHMLANGALVYTSHVESIMLKSAWHWDSDSSVINDPHGEPRHTLLCVRPSVHVGPRGW